MSIGNNMDSNQKAIVRCKNETIYTTLSTAIHNNTTVCRKNFKTKEKQTTQSNKRVKDYPSILTIG
jgi:hypothetical protein